MLYKMEQIGQRQKPFIYILFIYYTIIIFIFIPFIYLYII